MSKIINWLIGKNIRGIFGTVAVFIALISFYLYNLIDKIYVIGFVIAALVLIYGLYLHYKLGKIALLNKLRKQWGSPLITGSNMSGKSTFLRSVAVNAVLAQTICGTFTSKYSASFFKVTTSISQNDNLVGGKSYYLVEAEALLSMLNGVQSDIPSLCIVDEIFRGTNSKERIAAASQLLTYMSKLNALTIVATHDIELTSIVKDEYDIYYFDENVGAQGLIFDYHLKSGVSPTTNAIKILDYLGYPKEIVDNSNALISSEQA